ncbi:MAG: sensor histidine kinase [Agathobacter sp.]
MEFVKKYLKNRWTALAICIVWQAILYVTLFLEDVPAKKLGYPMLLSAAVLCAYFGFDFCRMGKKDKVLQDAKQNIDITVENLPETKAVVEQDYQELLDIVLKAKRQEAQQQKHKMNELTEFVTLWTHQVKTPLTALSLAVKESKLEEKAEYADRLFEIEQYCDIILQYLRMEGEGTDFLLAEYPVKPMVNQAVKYFARSFIGKGLSVSIDLPEERKLVTDEKWMVFVIKQVLSNALKYTKEGGITITMPKSHTICIADTGIGISKEDLPRITERGYTGYNGRRDKKATGIGLFLVDTIMKKLGGSVKITSELGVGTQVYLTVQ